MKNLFLIAAFLMASTFGFASSNTEKSTAKPKNTTTNVQKIDLQKFLEKVQAGEIGKGEFKYDANTQTFRFFPHMDSCGNVWEVTTTGMSVEEIGAALWALDGFLCSTGGVGSYTFYFY